MRRYTTPTHEPIVEGADKSSGTWFEVALGEAISQGVNYRRG